MLRVAALAMTLTGASLVVGAVQPVPVLAAGSLPACRYDDVPTKHSAYTDWQTTILDTIYKLPASYRPPDLKSTSRAGLKGGGYVRRLVIADLSDMAAAARKAGAGLRVASPYRSYKSQSSIYRREVRHYGLKVARRSSARPGHSEHQLGTTIDFGAASNSAGVGTSFARTAAGKWMKANAWKYGFVMSYPKGKTSKTCYYYEPWHFRYLGRDLAAQVHASGLTTREYLWYHFQ